mgnify:CR=1 FL=1
MLDLEEENTIVVECVVTSDENVASRQVSHVCTDPVVTGSMVVVAGEVFDVADTPLSKVLSDGPLSEVVVDSAAFEEVAGDFLDATTLEEVTELSDSGQVVVYSVVIPLAVIVTVERETGAVGVVPDSGHVVVYSVVTPLDDSVTVVRVDEVFEIDDVLP